MSFPRITRYLWLLLKACIGSRCQTLSLSDKHSDVLLGISGSSSGLQAWAITYVNLVYQMIFPLLFLSLLFFMLLTLSYKPTSSQCFYNMTCLCYATGLTITFSNFTLPLNCFLMRCCTLPTSLKSEYFIEEKCFETNSSYNDITGCYSD